MSKEKHQGLNDLADALTEDMTPVKALKAKHILADVYNHTMPKMMVYGLLGVATLCAIFAGAIMLSDLIQPPKEPVDWEQFGFMFLGLGLGVAMGMMLAIDDIIGRIRKKAVKVVEDAITGIEGDKE